jgi:hypothetical protein
MFRNRYEPPIPSVVDVDVDGLLPCARRAHHVWPRESVEACT